jgi:hypothetical protein
MWTRREFLTRGGALVGLAAGGTALLAVPDNQMPDGSASKGMITSATQKAIDQGLAWLAQNQHEDGSFGSPQHKGNVAISSLGALAFMSGGHQPGRGKYGKVVTRCLKYILSQEQKHPKGYLYNNSGIFNGNLHGPMYGHGFATLFLGEVYGMAHKKDLRSQLRSTLKNAVQLIIDTQNGEGGWRYKPEKAEIADISVTICQIMALRSARNAGLAVPKSTVRRCIDYVKACQNLQVGMGDGGFRYTRVQGPSGFARTAAGVSALYSAGVYKGREVRAGLEYLMKFKPGAANNVQQGAWGWREMEMHYFYGHYYAAQAMWTAGGKYWKEWYPAIRDELLNSRDRKREGYWYDRICTHYGTAMALIILQIPNNYLPILQK